MGCLWARLARVQAGQLLTSCSTWCLMPGHQTAEETCRQNHRMPWCLLWILCSVSCCRLCGTTIWWPQRSRSSWRKSSSRTHQYHKRSLVSWSLLGHPCLQNAISWEHVLSCSCAALYSRRRSALAGRLEVMVCANNSVRALSWQVMASGEATGAHERLLAVYKCFPGTWQMELSKCMRRIRKRRTKDVWGRHITERKKPLKSVLCGSRAICHFAQGAAIKLAQPVAVWSLCNCSICLHKVQTYIYIYIYIPKGAGHTRSTFQATLLKSTKVATKLLRVCRKVAFKKVACNCCPKSPSGLLWATSRSKHQRYRHYHDVTAVFLPVSLLKMADFKWTDEKTEDLISMYECRPWLYNVKLKEYSNRDKRKKGMEEIAKHFCLSGKFLTRAS